MIKLDCHYLYDELSPEVVATMVNGCGPGGWKFDIIPDNLFGLDIVESCRIHDFDYTIGQTEEEKRIADRRLLRNMRRQIKASESDRFTKLIRYQAARVYYESVQHCGHTAFWKNKPQPQETT